MLPHKPPSALEFLERIFAWWVIITGMLLAVYALTLATAWLFGV